MSRPNRVRMLLVLAFVLTLVAGVVAGIGFASVKAADNGNPPAIKPHVVLRAPTTQPDRNWLADQLGLNAEQRDKVSAIWKETPHDDIRKLDSKRRNLFNEQREAISALYTSEQRSEKDRLSRECDARVAELRQKRDEAVAALYSPEQKADKERLGKEFAAKLAEVTKEREKLLQPMLEKTRLVLTEEQRKRFDLMMKAGPGGAGFSPDRTGHRGGPSGRTGGNGPSTRPGSQPADWSRRDAGPRDTGGNSRPDSQFGGPQFGGPQFGGPQFGGSPRGEGGPPHEGGSRDGNFSAPRENGAKETGPRDAGSRDPGSRPLASHEPGNGGPFREPSEPAPSAAK